ncbi:MAG: acyl-CoA dehydrogenase family protein [Acidimicrobiales bacterium]
MPLALTPEQEDLRAVVRSFFDATSPESEVRRLMTEPVPMDRDLWRRMASELGVQSLALPEEVGGQGYGFRELSVVLEEAGRSLLCAPLLSSTVMASTLLDAIGDGSASELLRELAGGGTIAAVAVAADRVGFDPTASSVRARVSAGRWRLEGTAPHVIGGDLADVVLVVASTPEGAAVMRCDAGAEGLVVTPVPTLDLTRPAARLDFADTPAVPVGTPGAVDAAVARALDVTCVALAVESVGGAQRCLEMATDYARERVQFGRRIGSFQAVKHRCADMLLEIETARSAAYSAAGAVDATRPGAGTGADVDLAAEASLAKATTDEAYVHVANSTIQVHGGIGFTWEHPAHLYLKRAKSTAVTFGDAIDHRSRLGDRVGL